MVATSVGITAQVLAARGLLHCISSKIILAAAVIDDILGTDCCLRSSAAW